MTIATAPSADEPVFRDKVGPNRAGRLVSDQMPEPEVGRTLMAHWAIWAAAAIILALLAVGYVRRRLRSAARQSAARVSWASSGQEPKRKD